MRPLFDAFWRAVAYCMHPRVIGLSFLPLVLMAALSFGLGYFFWDAAVEAVGQWLQSYQLVQGGLAWLDRMGFGALRSVLAPLVLLLLTMPLIVLLCLLLVAVLMTPAMVELVGQRRFAALERKRGGSFFLGLVWTLGSTLVALLVMALSMPLWLVPPLVLILPPLIWGWLTYRVFAFDALAQHASGAERKTLLRDHRGSLLVMGVLSGYLGAVPSLLWASGALFVALAPLLVPVAIWLYTLVFAFASLWFSHYTLAALQKLRADATVEVLDPALGAASPSLSLPDPPVVLPPPGA